MYSIYMCTVVHTFVCIVHYVALKKTKQEIALTQPLVCSLCIYNVVQSILTIYTSGNSTCVNVYVHVYTCIRKLMFKGLKVLLVFFWNPQHTYFLFSPFLEPSTEILNSLQYENGRVSERASV